MDPNSNLNYRRKIGPMTVQFFRWQKIANSNSTFQAFEFIQCQNKKILKFAVGFLRSSHLSIFINMDKVIIDSIMTLNMDKHLDGAWDIFWIKSLNGTFIALKKIKFLAGVKKVPFWQFFRMGWDGCALLVQPTRIPRRN